MRKVFLDDLPTWGKSGMGNEGTINWKESEGYNVKFIYDDIKGFIKIINYDTESEKLTINYNDKHFNINSYGLKKCKMGNIIGKYTNRFRINIGESFEGMLITDRQYRYIEKTRNEKWYKYTCYECTWTEGWIREKDLFNGRKCSCCSGKIVVEGINDITTIAPWMIDLGIDKEDAKKYTKSSSKKIKCICPNCGEIKYKSCNNIYNQKTIACNCGDGFSYPEKFVYSALKYLGINLENQLSKSTFKWCGKYRYDFYIPSLSTIIEVNGGQHYKESFRGRTLKEEQKNDKTKKELALFNGVKHYIELDCRKSELDWIKNSILNSELNEIFDLSNIDWIKCEEYAIKSNRIKEICNYWNNKQEWETTTNVGQYFGCDRHTVLRCIKRGSNIGWCNYNTKDEVMKRRTINSEKLRKSRSKKVEVFKNNVSIEVFESCAELERRSEKLFGVRLLHNAISQVCKGKRKHHKGYTFKYIENKLNTI